MKLGGRIFALTSIALIFFLGNTGSDRFFPGDTVDSKIRLTSLSGNSSPDNQELASMPFFTAKEITQIGQPLLPAPNLLSQLSPPEVPEINAAGALVIELDRHLPLYELGKDRRWPIASLTKLMTATIAAEMMGDDRRVVLNNEDIEEEGNAGDFKAGETFTVKDLITAMMVVSSNDAASGLAHLYGYSQFINAMQEKAAELGMANTAFADPTGLTSLNQSTLSDLEKLIRYISKNHPEFLNMSQIKEVLITELGSGQRRILKNINAFAGSPDFLGGKTGYIDESGGNLISIFNYHNHSILIIVLGTADRFEETGKLYEWAKTVLQ